MTEPAIVVMAKAPVPGRCKTRLCPPCTPAEAAALAEAALADTLRTVVEVPARRYLALDGVPGAWLPPGVEVIPQRAGAFAGRLAAAFEDVGTPAVLIGMDTPQVEAHQLGAALSGVTRDDTDAVLGMADDGGWWILGLSAPTPTAFRGVPMSTARTGRAQLARLTALGCRVRLLPPLRDVDTIDDALAVATAAPTSLFASALHEVVDP